ncbi:TIGR00730 family Rossman fold protein [Candidatus Synchoanobacter obligatus]|uniref:Cytokinin riboside 5'-monophosphate phosphoribohydrolase n=1 Tax=Candidatus Synchoanobacter obligatus TaxID=2919597 RepID=A0ABT1L407_9GAMM|nr:TIGR00730 family Rossman fold protein [Candidatus Synchoanobacter obligatus]MCP8351910.1 TIGR00730 family Rossman fold protein [Candidatus Synchoanobacter obligatus]
MSTYESLSRIRGVAPMFKFISKLTYEMVSGLYAFRQLDDKVVTIYGSARFKPDNPYYQKAEAFGKLLAQNQINVMTGAGPGIMEAVNKGAYNINKKSHGCNIILPYEQKQNPFISCAYQTQFFFVRKFLLRHSSKALIAFPGGFGTMDELFESLTLIRTKCAKKIPTILIGIDYWSGLIDYLQNVPLDHGTISPEDLSQLIITDDINEALEIILKELANDS